ncbi:hypothetical protein WDW86_20685 [Bdellovibrionota bacterium FG-2]
MNTLFPEEIHNKTKAEYLSKEDLIQRNTILEFALTQVIRENYRLRQLKITDEQLQLLMEE